MFLITQYNIAVGIGELNGQPFRIDTVQHAPGWRSQGISATASSSNALHLPISRIARGGIRSTERWHTAPHSIPPLTTLEFYHRIAGGILHHAQRMIRQEILLKTLLFVSIKPGKIGLVIGKKYRSSVRYTGRYCRSDSYPTPWPNSLCPPTPLFFTRRDMVVGNVQQTAIFIVTPRADKIVLRFFGHI